MDGDFNTINMVTTVEPRTEDNFYNQETFTSPK